MNALWEILQFSISSLFWGILIAAVCMCLFFFAIKGWWKNAEFTIITYIMGFVLFILLSVQCIMICGAIKIISFTDIVEEKTQEILDMRYVSLDSSVSLAESEEVIQLLIDEFPIFENYFGSGYFMGYTVETLPAAIGDEIRSFMRHFIFRRLLWCLGFVVVSAIIAIKTISINNGSGGRTREGAGRRLPVGGDRSRPRVSGHSHRRTR